jgi:NhaP-type Na+/H+ or K+/H+ antiporter
LTSEDNGIDGVTVLKIIWQFCYTVVISIFIGGAIALFGTWMFKTFRFLCNPISEVVIVYLFGILSYLISEVLDMSGVLTVLVAGVVMAHFNFYNLSMTGQVATG